MFLGRVVRPGIDPQWLETDRGYALAWARNKAETCSGCGTHADDWADEYDGYVGDQHFCRGCQVLAETRDALPKVDDRPLPGWHAYLMPAHQYDLLHPLDDADM